MTSVSIGPKLSPDQETSLQRKQRRTALAEAEHAAEVIEEKISGMRETLQARRDEIAQLRAELEG